MTRCRPRVAAALFGMLAIASAAFAQQTSPGAGPVVVLETARGIVEFETYPEEAPKTVAHVLALVASGFYDGLRFHRAEPDLLVQVGDPATREVTKRELWGRSGSGTPVGVAEITKKRRNLRGAVGIAYAGSNPKNADAQFYILLRPQPGWDERYTVFGRVIAGMEVVERIERSDLLTKAFVKADPAAPSRCP